MRYQVIDELANKPPQYSVRDMETMKTVVIYDRRSAAVGHAATLNRDDSVVDMELVRRVYDGFTNCNAEAKR